MIADAIGELVPVAQAEGVTLGIEPLHPMFCADRCAISRLGEAVDLALQFPADAVGVVVDTYHVWWDSALAADLERAAGRIVSYQLCDWILPLPADVLLGRGHLGDGYIDFRSITKLVLAAGYQGYAEIEIFNADDLERAAGRDRFGSQAPLRRVARVTSWRHGSPAPIAAVPAAFGPARRLADVRRLAGGSKKGVYRLAFDDGFSAVGYIWDEGENWWPASAARSEAYDSAGGSVFRRQRGRPVRDRAYVADRPRRSRPRAVFARPHPVRTWTATWRWSSTCAAGRWRSGWGVMALGAGDVMDRLAASLELDVPLPWRWLRQIGFGLLAGSCEQVVCHRAVEHLAEAAESMPRIGAARAGDRRAPGRTARAGHRTTELPANPR